MSPGDRPTVYFHIGVPKSGTTYVQQCLRTNRQALRAAGVLYPGKGDSQFRACQDLLDWRIGGQDKGSTAGAWSHLVRQIERWPGTAVIDHELFCGASQPIVDRALADLAFADVHIVLTARDFARQLPAVWQTRLRTGAGGSYALFLAAVRSGPPGRGTARPFWNNQGVPTILERWAAGLPPEQVHVVTVPPSGSEPDLLWLRFLGVLGLDPAAFPGAPRGANTSRGATESALLRRINETVAKQNLPWPVYVRAIKHRLAPALAGRGGPAIELPEDVYAWAVEWSETVVADIRRAGYDVVGDLADLIPRSRPTGADPDAVDAAEQLDAAIAGLLSLAPAAARGYPRNAPRTPARPSTVAGRLVGLARRLRRTDQSSASTVSD
ncbi:MAG: hypothetical protein QOJ34_1520 [Pseudonocardiales bacterium]|nr:hypothetical protein [Pseudonocardiales bacterium]